MIRRLKKDLEKTIMDSEKDRQLELIRQKNALDKFDSSYEKLES